MKKIIELFLLLFLFINLPSFGQYTVKIRIGSIYIEPQPPGGQGHEWKCTSYADIFDNNGDLITPPNGTTYYWEKDNCDGQGFGYWGNGNDALTDGQILEGYTPTCDNSLEYQTSHIKVTVTINGNQYYSDVVRVPDDDSGTLDQNEIDLDQKKGNNTSVGLIGKLTGSSFLNYTVPFTFYYPANAQGDIFRASQSIISNEKYNNWAGYTDVINHRSFTFTSQNQLLTSQFNSIGDVTVNTSIADYPNSTVQMEFMDPWLIDDYSDSLGPKNRGIDADFLPLANTQNNVGINTNHQGVFLNQLVSSNVYYSIRAPLNPTVNGSPAIFLGWEYNSSYAELQQVDSTSGYDQKAVVFKQNGATITAVYTYDTISRNVTLASGTYNIAGTLTVNSGVTLTVNSGTTLNFPSGGGLVVNGTLTANGGTFTSSASDWAGITLNDAEGSTLSDLTISKALAPIKIINTSDVTISGCTINNSSFYDGNYNSAIQVSNSTPTISLTTISGQCNSQNGITFYNGSGDYFFDFSC